MKYVWKVLAWFVTLVYVISMVALCTNGMLCITDFGKPVRGVLEIVGALLMLATMLALGNNDKFCAFMVD